MTRVGHALLMLVGGACLAVGCSGSTARDKNYGTDAGSDFEPPMSEAGTDTGGDDGAAGAAGDDGATGGAAGAAGATEDASPDTIPDGGAG